MIFRFLAEHEDRGGGRGYDSELPAWAGATRPCQTGPVRDPAAALADFRRDFYDCVARRADALFELTEAVLCADGPVRSLPGLSLVAEHRRGHGALYDALAAGRLDVERLRAALTATSLPRAADGRIVLAVDVTCWLRPEAHTSPERILCHTYGRGKDQHIAVQAGRLICWVCTHRRCCPIRVQRWS